MENEIRNNIIVIRAEMMKVLNLSMQQNHVPFIRSIILNNKGDERIRNLHFHISFDPEFAVSKDIAVDELEPGGILEISRTDIILSFSYLYGLSERVSGTVTFSVSDEEENILGESTESLDIFTPSEWCGPRVMPELTAAFVMPNVTEVTKVMNSAADILKGWGGIPSFTGYQAKDADTVKKQMAAIYAAIKNLNINYMVPQASFETCGQRVRLPEEICRTGQGTCIDMALFYASCLEAAGLRPVITIFREHAYTSCWLEEEAFADCSVDDVTALRKRMAKGAEEMLPVECTAMNSGRDTDFDSAVEAALADINGKKEFELAVDIARCRISGIVPLPADREAGEDPERAAGAQGKASYMYSPSSLDNTLREKAVALSNEADAGYTKQQIWERRLLDFSMRNALLNFRGMRAIKLMVSDPGEVEDVLADSKDISILPVPSELEDAGNKTSDFFGADNDDRIKVFAAEELKQKRIHTFFKEEEMKDRLKKLQRAAKQSLEENGANTLFVAAGFLKWFETEVSQKPRYAPLVLIPVDIVRSIKGKGYIIRSRNEETQINVTLLEYLRQDHNVDISGLDPLPEDEHGIDLPLIFQTVRNAVMAEKNWDVENVTCLGLFSFGQFVMWNDLHNRASELTENKIVRSLIDGQVAWTPSGQLTELNRLDEFIKPDKVAVPLPADSSQMAAIVTAAAGESFVLHGPPGTGKSQTITNMIANALYNGKSVLFVAEKMAALSVVQRRLENIGLGPFCLEMHSNKAGKSAVLSQLEETLNLADTAKSGKFAGISDELYKTRMELDEVIDAVHEKRPFGVSLYKTISEYSVRAGYKGKVSLKDSVGAFFSAEDTTEENVLEYRELIREYEAVAELIGNYEVHPLKGIESEDYSMSLRDERGQEWKECKKACDDMPAAVKALSGKTGIGCSCSRADIKRILEMESMRSDGIPSLFNLASAAAFDSIFASAMTLLDKGDDYKSCVAELGADYDLKAFDRNLSFDASNLLNSFEAAQKKWFLEKFFATNDIVKRVSSFAKKQGSVTKANAGEILKKLSHVQELTMELQTVQSYLSNYFEGLYMGTDTDFTMLRAAVEKSVGLHTLFVSLPQQQWKDFSSSATCAPAEAEKVSSLNSVIESTISESILDVSDIEEEEDFVSRLSDRLNGYIQNVTALRDWSGYIKTRNKLNKSGLTCVTKAYEEGRIKNGECRDAFEAELYYSFATELIDNDERLREFRGAKYETLISRFKDKEEEYRKLVQQELVASLTENLHVGETAELALVKKTIKSGGRRMSIRKLFNEAPGVLRRLCPCMLMSPISVAQYIDPSFPNFDLVIFDEASQLPTSEAVGTIARGKNAVIVGDPKQLPPTAFFKVNKGDEDSLEEDLESLLDDCLAVSMPQMYLKWHYRSKHESLIAYSNRKYYGNLLATFPSPEDMVSRVSLVPVEGTYDLGGNRQNKAEAKAVTDEIIRRLSDEKLREQSIGVVTFSVVQQHLIEDMLADEFLKHPELEEYDRERLEPVFIKNLENVQGDERDVILFSICYGPDKTGKVSMNFGPLNREGGWRRLNVAISRARMEMMVFAVLKPEQIDTARSTAAGVEGLKGFLEYARYGTSRLPVINGEKREHDEMVSIIASEIEKLGYKTHTEIGTSSYRMDIGIVSPEKPDEYVLGIMLDGFNMRDAQTAGDRFSVQPGMMESLGWKTMHIWILEWFDDKERVLAAVKERIMASAGGL